MTAVATNGHTHIMDDLRLAVEVAQLWSRSVDTSTPLADTLYACWWSALAIQRPEENLPPWPSLAPALAAVHAGSSRFEAGWHVVEGGPAGTVLAARGTQAEQRWLSPAEVLNVARPGVPAQPGEQVLVSMRLDAVDGATGYWHTWSASPTNEAPLVRLYWNLGPAGALAMVRAFTTMVPDDVRFQLKAPSNIGGYQRADSVVLYLARDDWDLAGGAVRNAIAETARYVGPGKVPLTLPLAVGVSLAEDLGPTESFGSQRCRLLAQAVSMLPPASLDSTTIDDAVRQVGETLTTYGVDLERPWAESAGSRSYQW